MKYCALILMASLPTMWIVVGCLLILVTVISVCLLVWKVREVASLKKEVVELRDTMRMMRYEEANLARMLHTVDKQPEPVVLDNEPSAVTSEPVASIVEVSIEGEIVEPVASEVDMVNDVTQELVEEPVIESIEEFAAPIETEEQVCEKIEEMATSELEDREISITSEEEQIENSVEVTEQSEDFEEQDSVSGESVLFSPHTHKQAINERRPAIPVDLFAAWFAENEVEDEPLEVEDAFTAEPENLLSSVTGPSVEIECNEKGIVLEELVGIVDTPAQFIAEASAPETNVVSVEENLADDTSSLSGQTREDERFCRKLERIVHTRLRNPNLNIDVIASQFGMGRTNFYRKVREQMGVSPNDYLRRCRMERAAELLRTTDLPISEVCVQVGVPDAQYFSKVFKVYYETTPTAYREKSNN